MLYRNHRALVRRANIRWDLFQCVRPIIRKGLQVASHSLSNHPISLAPHRPNESNSTTPSSPDPESRSKNPIPVSRSPKHCRHHHQYPLLTANKHIGESLGDYSSRVATKAVRCDALYLRTDSSTWLYGPVDTMS